MFLQVIRTLYPVSRLLNGDTLQRKDFRFITKEFGAIRKDFGGDDIKVSNLLHTQFVKNIGQTLSKSCKTRAFELIRRAKSCKNQTIWTKELAEDKRGAKESLSSGIK